MTVIEVCNGFCRAPFECDFVPRSTFASHFVDITNASPRPNEFWRYDYSANTFVPPPVDANGAIDYNAAHMQAAKWNDVRNQRNVMLMESDWTQVPDSPLSWWDRRTWKKYRAALRRMPQEYNGNPLYLQFPPRPDRIGKPPILWSIRRVVAMVLGDWYEHRG